MHGNQRATVDVRNITLQKRKKKKNYTIAQGRLRGATESVFATLAIVCSAKKTTVSRREDQRRCGANGFNGKSENFLIITKRPHEKKKRGKIQL
jgi:hypothetical protein